MPIYDVAIPYSEVLRRRERWAAALRMERVTPPLVFAPFHSRYFAHLFAIPIERYFFDPAVQLDMQMRWRAWVLSNVRSDNDDLTLAVDQSHYGESWALGCELAFDTYNPWIRRHPVQSEADLAALERIDPLDNPAIEHEATMRQRMEALAPDYRLRFTDGVEICPAERMRPGPHSGTGLITLAEDLRGQDIYLDVKLRPEFVHRLMEVVTAKTIQRLEGIRRAHGYPMEGTFLNDDSAAGMSPRDYRQFVLPYNQRYKAHFGGKCSLHCCGPANHLTPFWAGELGVDVLWNFSFETDRKRVAQQMGGRTVLMGNVNWKLITMGTPDEVYRDSLEVLETFGAQGGHILATPNIAPGTPLDNINAMHASAADYAAREAR